MVTAMRPLTPLSGEPMCLVSLAAKKFAFQIFSSTGPRREDRRQRRNRLLRSYRFLGRTQPAADKRSQDGEAAQQAAASDHLGLLVFLVVGYGLHFLFEDYGFRTADSRAAARFPDLILVVEFVG